MPVSHDILISKHKIKKLINSLHKYGIKVFFYDEMGANDEKGFNPKFAIYPPFEYPVDKDYYSIPAFYALSGLNKHKSAFTIYSGYGPTGNPFTMKDYYSNQIKYYVL